MPNIVAGVVQKFSASAKELLEREHFPPFFASVSLVKEKAGKTKLPCKRTEAQEG